MAKELPYFKFEPNQWDNGMIQMMPRNIKGLFIDICSMYWSRLGNVPYALALQKLCNGDASEIDLLIQNGSIKVFDGEIVIDFLDEQLSEFLETSKKRQNAANKRWSNANALQKQSKSNAIREEKRREEKKREEERREKNVKRFTPPHTQELKDYFFEKIQIKALADHEAEKFFDFYSSKNWMVGKNKMKDWRAAVRNWIKRLKENGHGKTGSINTYESKRSELIDYALSRKDC